MEEVWLLKTEPDPGSTAVPAGSPLAARLFPNHPNPFNPSTCIDFELAQDGPTRLIVYDIFGREVRRLADGPLPAGTHSLRWDGRDADGRMQPAGVYLYGLEKAGACQSRKMLLIK